MTTILDGLKVEKKIVVVFDICSSSDIIESLILSSNLKSMRNFILSIKEFLKVKSSIHGFNIYKFIGDGWILLFPDNINGENLVQFLKELSGHIKTELNFKIKPLLESIPNIMGVTYGIDRGDVAEMIMMGQTEYIGRAINVASRLQSAIKAKDKKPAYKCLVSKQVYNKFKIALNKCNPEKVTRTLSNIRDGKAFECVKLKILSDVTSSPLIIRKALLRV